MTQQNVSFQKREEVRFLSFYMEAVRSAQNRNDEIIKTAQMICEIHVIFGQYSS